MNVLVGLHHAGLAQIEFVDDTGCEAFAQLIYHRVNTWMMSKGYRPRVTLVGVTVWEHDANGASYTP